MAETYKNAGVDIAAGDALVDWLTEQKPAKWHQDRLISGIGGFAALFRGDFPKMKEPVLVSSTDGVGTKVKLASHFKDFTTIGQDLVAMCVNDVLCVGAQPLFFLDYYAVGKLDLNYAQQFLAGVRKACDLAECALIGGETAEMPGVYQADDFDCAGFVVGVVDRSQILGADRVNQGDVLIGIGSSGFHSNGYSLVRKVFEKDLADWKQVLLTPTHLYSTLARRAQEQGLFSALANITGGGMDNLLRVLPEGSAVEFQRWAFPAEFQELQKRTGMSDEEMLKTLNCGLGMIAVVKPENEAATLSLVRECGFKAMSVGRVTQLGQKGLSRESTWKW